MRRRSIYKKDDSNKTLILRRVQDEESRIEKVEALIERKYECKKCGKDFPRGLYMHERYCKGHDSRTS